MNPATRAREDRWFHRRGRRDRRGRVDRRRRLGPRGGPRQAAPPASLAHRPPEAAVRPRARPERREKAARPRAGPDRRAAAAARRAQRGPAARGKGGGTAGGAGGGQAGGQAGGSSGGATGAQHWVGTWTGAPQLTETENNPPASLSNAALRQMVHVSLGGSQIRVRFSNEFGNGKVVINKANVAVTKDNPVDSAIDTATDKALSFSGMASVTIAQGKAVWSDPLDFTLAPLSNLAVTIAFGSVPSNVTGTPARGPRSTRRPAAATSAPPPCPARQPSTGTSSRAST